MSLVNLASVCSHLQNASLARLGLTSIPYTKLHLSLALLLQKQGFLSQVKLGGPSPPASVFGQGPRDNHFVTNYPHGAAGRNRFSPEAALALVVRKGYTPHQLQREGYGAEAIQFAQEHGIRTAEDLEKAGWAKHIHRFVAELRAQINALADEREQQFFRLRDDLTSIENFDESTRKIDDLQRRYGDTTEERYEKVENDVLENIGTKRAEIYRRYKDIPSYQLESTTFDLSTLQTMAGQQSYISERELRLKGITIEAMGLRIPNQSITLPEEEFQDPTHMETEGIVTKENRASRRLWLGLKYYESLPVLTKAQMISKPTKRIWLNSQDIGKVVRGKQTGEVKPMGKVGEIMAVSTDQGIFEARECMERKIGGMPLCRVW